MWILQFHELDAFIVKVRSYDVAQNQFILTLYEPIAPNGAQAVMEFIRQSYEGIASSTEGLPCAKLSLKRLDPVGTITEIHDFHLVSITSAEFRDMTEDHCDQTEIDLTFFYKSVKVRRLCP